MNRIFCKTLHSSGLAALLVATTAYGEDTTDRSSATTVRQQDNESIEIITVTATKRGDATAASLPMSIQAIGAQALERRNVLEFTDFSKQVAGLSTFDQGPGNKRYVLRGISSAGAGTVGVYLDEIVLTGENSQGYAGLQADPRIYDLERIEVLKGPQGTTFGSSALSGVVRYLVAKPEMNSLTAHARAAVTDQRLAGIGGNGDLTVNIPLIDDKLAVRASGFYQYRPGYISNRYEDDANTEHTYSGRAQLRARPMENLTLDLFYQVQDTDTGLSYYNSTLFDGTPVPSKYYQSAPERVGMWERLDLYNATLNYDTNIGTVTASASHTERSIRYDRPATQVLANATRLSVDNPNIQSLIAHPRLNKVDAFELRFASDWQSSLGLLAGIYYQKDERDFASRILTVDAQGHIDPVGGIFGPVLQDRSLFTSIEEKALFGELTWDITDKLQVVGGLRAFSFDNSSQSVAHLGIVNRVPGRPGTGDGPVSKSDESSVIGRGIVSYEFRPGTKLYAQVSQGYRPGGANDQAAAALGGATVPAGYESDRLVNYEIGIKRESEDRRFFMAIAGYYIDWTDIQLVLRTSPGATGTQYAYTGNAGTARVYGTEIETTLRPIQGLSIGLSGSYINAAATETIPGAGVDGESIPYTPRWSGSVSADYTFDVLTRPVFLGADVAYTGTRLTDFAANSGYYFELEPYTVVNARAGVEFGTAKVSLVLRNAFDDATVTDVFMQTAGVSLNGFYRVPPRTLSLELSASF